MNYFINNKTNKETMQHMLTSINSPLAELYKNKYPKKDNISKILNEFFDSRIMQEHKKTDDIELLEAEALINWIYKSISKIKEREEATKELIIRLLEKYNLKEEIIISKGIVYLKDRVEVNFISSIDELYKCINSMSLDGRKLFFRGHSKANHILVPSLMRKQNWLINERKMYNELLINSPESFEKMKSHLEYLVEMQHYGLPTRLLDITSNPLVAVYFACESYRENYGEIVFFSIRDDDIKYHQSDTVSILASLPMFEYEKQQEIYNYAADKNLPKEEFNNKIGRLLHEVRSEKPAFKDQILKDDLLHSKVVLPLKNNNRILKQDGAFILCGLSKDYRHLDINELRYKESNGKQQIFIVENKEELIEILNVFSINKATLFPEIDDVADYIKSKY